MKTPLRLAGLVMVSALSVLFQQSTHAAGPTVRYVLAGGAGTRDGRSWENASGDLQAMIQSVAGPPAARDAQVWVAAGTYLPSGCPNGGVGGRELHFSLRNLVSVYGGFPSTGAPTMADRNPAAHPTILSGDIGTSGDSGDNAFHVFYHPVTAALDGSAVLDGVTIRGGRADGGGSDQENGGGMFNHASSPTLVACRFENNFAAANGGGICNRNASPMLRGIQFHRNEAGRGGGIYNDDASAPVLSRCGFVENIAEGYGGGVFSRDGAPAFFNCFFAGNLAGQAGGGMCSGPDAPVLLSNCVLFRNVSKGPGGGLFHHQSAATVANSTFTENEAATGGGAALNADGSAARFRNSVIWGNSSEDGAREIGDDSSSASKLENCVIRDGWTGEGSGNSEEDPLFVSPANPEGPDGIFLTDDDGLRVTSGSPTIDAGVNGYLPADSADLDADGNTAEALPLDARDRVRVYGILVDIGAYERQHFTVTIDTGPHATRIGGGELVQQVEEGGAAVPPQLRMAAGWTLIGWSPPMTDIIAPTNPVAQTSFVLSGGGVCHVKVGGTGSGANWAQATGDFQGAIEAMASVGGGQVWVAAGTYKPDSWPNGGTNGREKHFSLRNGVAVLGGFPATGEPGLIERNPSSNLTVCSGDIETTGHPGDNTFHVFFHPWGVALDATARLDGVRIEGGEADASSGYPIGAGMVCQGSSPTLLRCVFRANHAQDIGGGLGLTASNARIIHCVFTGNRSEENGGAILVEDGTPEFSGCLFADNTTRFNGGAIYVALHASCSLRSCTFSGNNVQEGGGCSVGGFNSTLTASNCVMWRTPASPGGQVFMPTGSIVSVSHSIIQGGWSGTGNLDTDPAFLSPADADGADNQWFTADDGLRISMNGGAYESGNSALLPPDREDLDKDGDTSEPMPIDLRGQPRVSGSQLDIGAYEVSPVTVTFDLGAHATRIGGGALSQQVLEGASVTAPSLSLQPGWAFSGWDAPLTDVWAARTIAAQFTTVFTAGSICHVKVGGTGSGATWAEATGDFQGAIEAISAVGGGQVWVAEGTYKPNSWPNGGTAGREAHFSLRSNVKIYGGFPGTGDPGFAVRDPACYVSVCSGDIGVLDNPADNIHHVFYHPTGSLATGRGVLDGFVVRDGNATDAIFGGNRGGGLYSGTAFETYVGCVFRDNQAVEGGGIFSGASGSQDWHARRFANCVVTGNHASTRGGGIRIAGSPAFFQNTLVVGNQSDGEGGGVSYVSSFRMINCTIHSNTAGLQGGGTHNSGGTVLVYVENSVFWGNSAPDSPQIGVHIYFPYPRLSSCVVQGGYQDTYYDNRISSADPLFQNGVDPDGADNRWFTADDGLRLQETSPVAQWAREDLLDADIADVDRDGNTAEILPLDATGAPRVKGTAPEPGAYELNPAAEHLPYWRSLWFSYPDRDNPAKEGGLWGNAADPDGDGIPNCGEYALMKNPLLADASPVHLIEPYPGWKWLVCEYYLAKNRPDVLCEVRRSSSLLPGSWTLTGLYAEVLEDQALWQCRRVILPVTPPRGFLRFQFTIP